MAESSRTHENLLTNDHAPWKPSYTAQKTISGQKKDPDMAQNIFSVTAQKTVPGPWKPPDTAQKTVPGPWKPPDTAQKTVPGPMKTS